LLRNEEGQQVFTIKAVQIGERSAIHGQSMPSKGTRNHLQKPHE
jgi:hypothetical protein